MNKKKKKKKNIEKTLVPKPIEGDDKQVTL
jgi:hypothetical protein